MCKGFYGISKIYVLPDKNLKLLGKVTAHPSSTRLRFHVCSTNSWQVLWHLFNLIVKFELYSSITHHTRWAKLTLHGTPPASLSLYKKQWCPEFPYWLPLLTFWDNNAIERWINKHIKKHNLLSNGRIRECPYNVLDAKFVSSCLSLPSKAKPRFSRLFARNGVRVYTLQNVALGATISLEHGTKQRVIRCQCVFSYGSVLFSLQCTYSDSSVATGHLYWAVLKRQISAYWRTATFCNRNKCYCLEFLNYILM